jgi:hypothetical protein
VETGEGRRAVVVYVDAKPHLVSDFRCLHASVQSLSDPETDLIAFGPQAALRLLPAGCIKVELEPRSGRWESYGYINSLYFLTTAEADVVDGYESILRTDADTFLLPGWSDYRPANFRVGRGLYANDQATRDNLARVARALGLRYQHRTNLGSTHFGRPAQLREVAHVAFEIADRLVSVEFGTNPGSWPGWYRGVSSMYANELAVNHLVDDFERDGSALDASSASALPARQFAHAHCWHTRQLFSKFAYRAGEYDRVDPAELDLRQIRFYCLWHALRARDFAAT